LACPAPTWREIDPTKHPIIAAINRIAGLLVEILGPMFWAALIVLFVWSETFAN